MKNWVFLMDPLESVVFEKDTTYALMCEVSRRGFPVYYLPKGGLFLDQNQVWFKALRVTATAEKSRLFIEHDWERFSQDSVAAVFVRTDPPFDADYLMHTWLLDRLPASIPVINKPAGIRTVNEKIWATQFSELIPPTMVTRHKEEALHFLATHGDSVVKPTDGFGGASVFKMNLGDPNVRVIIETMTDQGDREVILQKFVPEAAQGDKRILLLNGTILGAVLRVHGKDDHRNNFFSGGKPQATEVTPRDREIVTCLKPHLQALGLDFVGIDVMGDYLIEVNVTSPTCLQEMNRLYNVRLEAQVIDFAERLLDHGKAV